MAIKNVAVVVRNGEKELVLLDGKAVAKADAVNKVVTTVGGKWTNKEAEKYLAGLERLDYFAAIDMLIENGKTLAAAVTALDPSAK